LCKSGITQELPHFRGPGKGESGIFRPLLIQVAQKPNGNDAKMNKFQKIAILLTQFKSFVISYYGLQK